jgi:glutamine synthetase
VRLAGADVDPYLLLTTIIASGMQGIKDKIAPPPIEMSNAYYGNNQERDRAPQNIYDAAKIFEKSEFATQTFGAEYKNHLIKLAETEWEDFTDHISNFEINRYIEMA